MEKGLLTVGQMARLMGVNKKTLHYYDEEGLFRPACVGENGYRYYSFEQCAELLTIIHLRKAGVPVAELASYENLGSTAGLSQVVRKGLRRLDEQMARLEDAHAFLSTMAESLEEASSAMEGKVLEVEHRVEYILVLDERASLDVAIREASRRMSEGNERYAYLTFGAILALPYVLSGDFDAERTYYVRVTGETAASGVKTRPSGTYLVTYCPSAWDATPESYRSLLESAAIRGLEPSGDAYEEFVTNPFSADGSNSGIRLMLPVRRSRD